AGHRHRLHHDLHAGRRQLRRAGAARLAAEPLVHPDHLQLVLRGRELEHRRGLRLHAAAALPRLRPADDAAVPRRSRGYRAMTAATASFDSGPVHAATGSTRPISERIARIATSVYIWIFFFYLFAPLLVMAAATFNDSRFPTI